MKYEPKLESIPCPPIILPEIPRREMVIPMPGDWLDEMNRHGIDPAVAVSKIVCKMFSYHIPGNVSVRDDFTRAWHESHARRVIPRGGDWPRVMVPIRVDVWKCIERAAAMVNRPAHEVFLKVLARQIETYRECRRQQAANAEKQVTLAVPSAALEALAAARVPVETAVLVFSPHDEKDCLRLAADWDRRSTRYLWSPRKALKWVLAAPRVRTAKFKVLGRQWQFIEQAAAAVGITPDEWCLSAIGYRAALEMRKPLR